MGRFRSGADGRRQHHEHPMRRFIGPEQQRSHGQNGGQYQRLDLAATRTGSTAGRVQSSAGLSSDARESAPAS